MKIQGPYDGQSGALRESNIGLRSLTSRERRGSTRPTYIRSDGVGSHRSVRSIESDTSQAGPTVSRRERDRSVYPNNCPPTPESDGMLANVLAWGGGVGRKEWISIALCSDSGDRINIQSDARRLMGVRCLVGVRHLIGVRHPIGIRHPIRDRNRRFRRLFGNTNRHGFSAAWQGAIGPNPLRRMEATWPDLGPVRRIIRSREGPDTATCHDLGDPHWACSHLDR